jgi:hypothetical protein
MSAKARLGVRSCCAGAPLRLVAVAAVCAGVLQGTALAAAEISDLVEVKVEWGPHVYYIPFEDGPYCVQLSPSQYDRARSQGLLCDKASAINFKSKWSEPYIPDGDGSQCWFCFEDYGGDSDYNDVVAYVTDNTDGTFDLLIGSGNTGHLDSLVSLPGREHLVFVPANSSGIHLTVPEPVALALLALGGAGLWLRRRKG